MSMLRIAASPQPNWWGSFSGMGVPAFDARQGSPTPPIIKR